MKKVLFINLIILIIGILSLEIFFGKWLSKEKYFCSYLLCDKEYKFKHNLFGKDYKGIYSKNSDGLRGEFKDNSNIKILVLGGSTTDQRYLSDNDTWTHQLQTHFENMNKNLKIANAGIDGQSTIGHIWNFKNWFINIKNLKPEIIIFYIGINDLLAREKSHYDFEKNKFGLNKLYFKQLVKNNSAIYYLINTIYSNKKEKEIILNFNKKVTNTNFNYNIKSSITKDNLEIYEKKYLDKDLKLRLETLIDETYKYGAIPIFITQQTRRWLKRNEYIYGVSSNSKDIKLKIDNKKFKINSADIGLLEKKFSSYIVEFCKIKKLFCIDGFEFFELNIEDTYDLMHLNSKGSKKIAKIIFNKIFKNTELKERLKIN